METWLKLKTEFITHFSYRMPESSSQFAITSLLPGPTTIKLAIVSTAIWQKMDVKEGERVFEMIKNSDIKIKIPEKIAIFEPFLRRLYPRKKDGKLDTSFGRRGFVLFSESLEIFIKCKKEIKNYAEMIRYLGSSDSLCRVKVEVENPPDDCIEPVTEISEKLHGIIQIVKDIKRDASFNDVNPYYRSKSRNPYENRFYVIPVRLKACSKNWKLFEKI